MALIYREIFMVRSRISGCLAILIGMLLLCQWTSAALAEGPYAEISRDPREIQAYMGSGHHA